MLVPDGVHDRGAPPYTIIKSPNTAVPLNDKKVKLSQDTQTYNKQRVGLLQARYTVQNTHSHTPTALGCNGYIILIIMSTSVMNGETLNNTANSSIWFTYPALLLSSIEIRHDSLQLPH